MAEQQRFRGTHFFISTGTIGFPVLQSLKRMCLQKTNTEQLLTNYLALDTNDDVVKFASPDEIECMLIGPRRKNPEDPDRYTGSGCSPERAAQYFEESKDAIIARLKPMHTGKNRIESVSIIGSAGYGGTSTGTFDLMMELVHNELGITPTGYLFWPAQGEITPRQLTQALRLRERIFQKKFHIFQICMDYLTKDSSLSSMEINQADEKLFEMLAEVVFRGFNFYSGTPGVDRSDLESLVLDGAGYLKMVQTNVDLQDPQKLQEGIQKAFEYCRDHQLFHFEGTVGNVTAFLEGGGWTREAGSILSGLIYEYASKLEDSKDLNYHSTVKISRVPPVPGQEKTAGLVLLFSSILHPEPAAETIDETLSGSPSVAVNGAVAPNIDRGNVSVSREYSHSWNSWVELLQAAERYSSDMNGPNFLPFREAWKILSKGDPALLRTQFIKNPDRSQDTRKLIPVIDFKVDASWGAVIIKCVDTAMMRAVCRLENHQFSAGWQTDIVDALRAYLNRNRRKLPRRAKPGYWGEALDISPTLTCDAAIRHQSFREFARKHPVEAALFKVAVCLVELCGFEAVEPLLEVQEQKSFLKLGKPKSLAFRRTGVVEPSALVSQPVSGFTLPVSQPVALTEPAPISLAAKPANNNGHVPESSIIVQ